MKNTTFRKKALLSSVAMLLVALVALGSATFAWFTANPDSSAEGLSMETNTSTGLVVLSNSEKKVYTDAGKDFVWDHNAILDAVDNGSGVPVKNDYTDNGIDIQPRSYYEGSFYSVEATDENSYVAADDAAVTTDSTSVFSEEVFFKVTGSEAANAYLKKVNMEQVPNALTIYEAVRVMVTNTNKEVIGTYGLDSAGNLYLTGSGEYKDVLSEDKYAYTKASESAFTGIEIGNIKPTGEDSIKIYVYLDGEDDKCRSNNVNATQLVKNITFEFSLNQ